MEAMEQKMAKAQSAHDAVATKLVEVDQQLALKMDKFSSRICDMEAEIAATRPTTPSPSSPSEAVDAKVKVNDVVKGEMVDRQDKISPEIKESESFKSFERDFAIAIREGLRESCGVR